MTMTTTIKRTVFATAVFWALLICLAAPAHATPQQIHTRFDPGINQGQTIAHAYQNFILPKFPSHPSSGSAFEEHFQIHSHDAVGYYNFVYVQIDKVCVTHIGGCTLEYQVEVTYQDQIAGVFHDGFLLDYALPGDTITWFYDQVSGNDVSARIVNNGASGHASWDHTGTWTWVGKQPDEYQTAHFTFTVDPFGLTHNCFGDMPAQDVPGSGAHTGTLTYRGRITLADSTVLSVPLYGADTPPVTTVSPTDCMVAVPTSGGSNPFIYYVMSWYAGG